jgi:hypothetical protein
VIKGESKVVYEWQGTNACFFHGFKVLAVQPGAATFLDVLFLTIHPWICTFAASGSLSAKIKKVQGARVKSRTGVGAIKFGEEMSASSGEVREQVPCDLTREERRSNAKLTCSD